MTTGCGLRQIRLWPKRVKNTTECTTRHLALGNNTRAEGASSIADKTPNSDRFARDPKRTTAATAIGMSALKPIMHFQVSMLRMWADSIERFAGKYEKGFEETATTIKEQSDKERAA